MRRLLVPALVVASVGCVSSRQALEIRRPTADRAVDGAGGGAGALDRALAGVAGPVRVELGPGRYVLQPAPWTDPSCGNCEDPTESVPTTLGLRVSGTSIEIIGVSADSVIIETGAGYGVLFEDCENCSLRGVTVTGGTRSPDGRATDAAVVVRRSTVTLDECVLRDNIGDPAVVAQTIVGIAGVAVRENGVLSISGCRIERNSWDGVALYRGASAEITDNVIDGVDRAAGARIGGGRGVGIGLTWDARARVERNLVRRYWKGIGAFVSADADIRENVVEDILTWGIALWGPGGAHPAARIERNIVFHTGACGVMIDRQDGGGPPGTLTDNIIVQTGRNDAYDRGEPYCWQRPIARHAVPVGFTERDNVLTDNRQPIDAGPAGPPLTELTQDVFERQAQPLMDRLVAHPALRAARVFTGPRDLAAVLRPHAAAWERLLAAEDARAGSDAELQVLLDGLAETEPELRRIAVRALGRLERADLLEHILPLLNDASPRVRASAADATAQAVHRHAVAGTESIRAARDALLAALPEHEDDAVAVAAIAESVGRLRHPDATVARAVVDRLVPHLIGTNETRLGALRGLFFTARQPAARGVLGPMVHDALRRQVIVRSATAANDARTRSLALATLVAAGGADVAVLDSVLDRDPAPHVRREAVAAAAALADETGARWIVTRGLRDSSAIVRYEALRLHGRRDAGESCDAIVAAVDDQNAHVALLAIDLLGSTCSSDARSGAVLRGIVQRNAGPASDGADSALHARRSAARALRALATAEPAAASRALGRYAADDDVFVRMYAARAAGALANNAALNRFASDTHPNVRTVAVQELSRMVGPQADAIYLTQLQHDDVELLLAVSAALEGSRAPGAAVQLLGALDRVTQLRRETSRDARRALLERVGELGGAALQPRVQPYLRDFDPAIAEQAATTIESWTGTRPQPAPAPLARQELPAFEEAAALERARFLIEMESGGTVTLRLLPFDATTNAARFARLAREGYYNGLTLHRVVPNFVVQGGSPHANEYSGDGPFTRDELGLVGNYRGTVGLSTRGRDTGDAQLFINLVDNVRLDHDYTVFGVVLEGMDVVDAMLEGVRIRRITVHD